MDEKEKIYYLDSEDPEMVHAMEKARKTFKYFYREYTWDLKRVVPALDLACVKVLCSDQNIREKHKEMDLNIEQMWIVNVDFDGEFLSGELINEPETLKSVKLGDTIKVSLDQISDWMYSINYKVYGGYTVNLIRSKLSPKGREEHDAAWGLNFCDAKNIRLFPKDYYESNNPFEDHPMDLRMIPSLKSSIAATPSLLTEKDTNGSTLLHREALAGNAGIVKALLDLGANPALINDLGKTPLDLAKSLNWEKIISLLS